MLTPEMQQRRLPMPIPVDSSGAPSSPYFNESSRATASSSTTSGGDVRRDANGLTLRADTPPKRTEVQQVNEALRTKLSQMVVLRQKLERTLSATKLESNRVACHIRDLTQLLHRYHLYCIHLSPSTFNN
jgi:hypothetical protein